MAALLLMRRRCIFDAKVWWSGRRPMSGFDDTGSVLRAEERSREAVYMRKRDAELLEKLRKQGEKLEEIKRAFAEHKEGQSDIEKWVSSNLKDAKPT